MTKNEETFLPSEEWREEFEKQATTKLIDRMYRAARSRLRLFAGPTGHVDSADVEDIVMGVLGDTLKGKLFWNPEKESLENCLLDAIKFRVRNRWEKEQRRKHDPIEEDDDARSVAEQAAAGATVPAAPAAGVRQLRIKAVYDDVIAALRPRCVGQPRVLELLELYMDGVTERDDVLRESGMSEREYKNARERLGRLVQDLPAKLRDAALAALTTT